MTDGTGSIVFQCLDFVARDVFTVEKVEDEVQDDKRSTSGEEYKPYKTYEKKKYYSPKEPSPDDEKRRFQILLFGSNHEGKSVTIEITGYRPYFYIQIPEDWSKLQKSQFEKYLLGYVHDSPEAQELITIKETRHKKLYDFDNGFMSRFLRVEVPSIAIWRRISAALLTEGLEPKALPEKVSKRREKLKVYESNIDPVLRFFHERNLEPAGWMRIPPHKFDEIESDITKTELSYTCEWTYIEPDTTRISLAPLLIASWDIECTSSHGDFPQPKKTWRKPAREILEANIKTYDDVICAIADALNGAEGSQISHIYPKLKRKNDWTFEEMETIIDSKEELESFLTQKDTKLDERISSLDEYLTSLALPDIKGDEIIQIGVVLYRNNRPESKHIFVLNTCDRDKVAPPTMREVPVHVYPFKKEADMLNGFHAWLQKTDPDCMIGYNIFGFDEKYVWERCEELSCTTQADAWSRLTSGKPRLVEKFLSSAAMGDNTMYIINAPGRLKVDLLPYIRRNYNLDSYTLDNVSATFMSGAITGKVTELESNILKVPTKSTKGAVIGRFVVLLDDDNDHVIDKAEIVGSDEKSIHIKVENGTAKLLEHGIAPTRWAQVKDDVSPKEIFALQKGTAADRAKIARYCLQDCDLVMELFMKLDVLNNSVAMANVCSVPVSFIFMRGQGVKIESLIFKECRLENQLIEVLPAPKNSFGNEKPLLLSPDGEEEKPAEDVSYEGAFVLEPVTGIYFDNDPVGVPDFSSLYPSTIISENLCHSSLVWVKDHKLDGSVVTVQGSDDYDNREDLGIQYIDVDYDILINDPKDTRKHPTKISDGRRIARFAQLPNGEKSTIPKILQKLLSARKATRKRAEKETDEFRKALLDAQQLAYKLTANSLYGQLGSGTSKIRHVVIAASTTAYGRKQLIYAKTVIEEVYGKGNDTRCDAMCVYGDTDSIFVRWRPQDPATGERLSGEEAVRIAKELTEESGALISSCLKAPHDFEFDKVFRTFCLLSKKRYVGDMSEGDLDDFHRKAMGIVMKRRDNAPIVKYVYGGVIENILSKQDIIGAFNFAQKACQELVDGKFSISKLTITKSLRAEYKTPTPPAHKVLAERIGIRDPGNKPSTTERIPYVYIPAPPNSTSQGDRIETPTFIKANNITPDYAFYITNQIAKPVAQVFGLVVEQLPGVKKADIQRLKSIENPSKRVDEREKLASEMLFGAILNKISKERKVADTKKKVIDETQARQSFINGMFKQK